MKTRKSRKGEKAVCNQKIVRKYDAILKRMGEVRRLTPQYEIMEEIAQEFNISAETVSRIINKLHKQK